MNAPADLTARLIRRYGDGVASWCAALAVASGLDESRLLEWCRGVALVMVISYLKRAGTEQAVAEMLELAR